MGDEVGWSAAPENTLPSLRHGITMFDGIEFDIRITSDQELVIHHDRTVSIPKSALQGRSPWTEEWTLDELEEVGFLSFEDLLKDSTVREHWTSKGKMGCVEIKRPHPKAASGGGFLGKQHHIRQVSETMKLAEAHLDAYEIPRENTVFYAFHKHMPQSAKMAQTNRPWAALIPYIAPYGSRNFQRIKAFRQYLTTPFGRLIRHHRQQGSSMLPCAMEYFETPTKYLPLGRHVGLSGNGLKRLTAKREGMPTYVWPTKARNEHAVLEAGMTALTDSADPALSWLPSGHARWRHPATRPLDESQKIQLKQATQENHQSILTELMDNTPTWEECDAHRRQILVKQWKSQWNWQGEIDAILQEHHAASPPWSTPRLIGHRGSGKTSRPVLTDVHSM
ncbi:MAG: hypothetical protein L7S56_05340 [Candidatus Poseidonia sp.]|nr:hypothetical protein [Poseidonia sp.]